MAQHNEIISEEADNILGEFDTSSPTAPTAPTATTTASQHHQLKTQQLKSNEKYVAPFGILTVLFTLYLSCSALKNGIFDAAANIAEDVEATSSLSVEQAGNALLQKDAEPADCDRIKLILHKLLEHPEHCYDLEIFTKQLPKDWLHLEDEEEQLVIKPKAKKIKANANVVKRHVSNNASGNSVANGRKTKRNGNGRHLNNQKYQNKSLKTKTTTKTMAKVSSANKKEQQPANAKKSSTAEPIIYLFAMVFIYLLLKAASEINQHYKAQSKGDKRMRRYSLQSYAQAHKPDRRASKAADGKGTPIKHKQPLHLLDTRSKSFERSLEVAKKQELLAQLRQYTSMDEQQRSASNTPPWNYMTANNSPTVMTPTDNTNVYNKGSNFVRQDSSTFATPGSPSRRCSTPTALSQQRFKISGAAAVVPTVTTRRTSVVIVPATMPPGSAKGSLEGTDLQLPEVKRRVRMINRH